MTHHCPPVISVCLSLSQQCVFLSHQQSSRVQEVLRDEVVGAVWQRHSVSEKSVLEILHWESVEGETKAQCSPNPSHASGTQGEVCAPRFPQNVWCLSKMSSYIYVCLFFHHRPLCRYDVVLQQNDEVTFKPIPCEDSNFWEKLIGHCVKKLCCEKCLISAIKQYRWSCTIKSTALMFSRTLHVYPHQLLIFICAILY